MKMLESERGYRGRWEVNVPFLGLRAPCEPGCVGMKSARLLMLMFGGERGAGVSKAITTYSPEFNTSFL